MPESNLTIYAFRLKPGQDLKKELVAYVNKHHITAGFILTCVGSLQCATLRLADREKPSVHKRKFEIVSLVGTLEPDGGHLHISLSDSTGRTMGGHLMEGSLIYTTAEIVIGVANTLRFTRAMSADSGYEELVVEENKT